jgi:FtsZ-binding cell division protein ZapB
MRKADATRFSAQSDKSYIERHRRLCARSIELRQQSQELRRLSNQLRQDAAVRQQVVAALVVKLSQY